jgi:hypothetical protein
MKEEKIEQFLIRKREDELLEILRSTTADIKRMMTNVYKAAFRFGLNETQTVYLLNEATKPFKMLVLRDLLEV